jgi:shikimate O-hydroxycinnamoyltransferase
MPGKLDKTETIAIKCTPLADGGAAIGLTLNHTLLDGEGLFTFMKAWGQRYSGVSKEERLVINHDRHLLSGMGRPSRPPPSEVLVAPLASGDTAPISQLRATTLHAFHVSKASMIELKALARREIKATSSTQDPRFVSTVDLITALFVILISRARGHGQDVRITTTVNGRRRLDPPLPDNYAGNCVFSALSAYSKDESSGDRRRRWWSHLPHAGKAGAAYSLLHPEA